MTDRDQDPGRSVTKLFGALLMAAGGLIAALCGLCSAAFLVSMVASSPGDLGSTAVLVLIFGGAPIALGVGLCLWGSSLWRKGGA